MWHYENFCEKSNVQAYPGEAKVLGACLSLRANSSQSVSMVEKLHAAVSHEHKLKFLPSPTEHPTIKLLMRSIRRKYTKPRNPVKPLELVHLRKLNQHLASSDNSTNLSLWRTVWRMNISYYTLCRFSEINNLTTTNLDLSDTKISIQIVRSKTDQNGLGRIVNVYSIPDEPAICPVLLTKQYLQRLAYPNTIGSYVGNLQPRIHYECKNKIQIPLPTQLISYSSCLEDSRRLLTELGIEGRFGEHSGRRGGATAAASHGASLQDVQQLGQWKSAECASKYVDQNEEQKIKTFRLLYPHKTFSKE